MDLGLTDVRFSIPREGALLACIIPEPTARSAVRRRLLIPHGYLHPGKSKHSEV